MLLLVASVGHVAVGLAAARLRGRPSLRGFVFWSALALLPDLDALGFALGVPYAAPFGHRGATHSLAAALAAGALVAFAARRASTGAFAAAVVASHGLFDAFTNGGLGVALLWPFTTRRFFAPWRPLPVAPIGAGLWSAHGLRVMAFELAWFLPLFVYALWPRRGGRADVKL